MTDDQMMQAQQLLSDGRKIMWQGWRFEFDWAEGYKAEKAGQVEVNFGCFPTLIHDMQNKGMIL